MNYGALPPGTNKLTYEHMFVSLIAFMLIQAPFHTSPGQRCGSTFGRFAEAPQNRPGQEMSGIRSSAEATIETGLVECRVLAIHPVFSSKIMALASVELDIDGIVMTIHGIQVVKAKGGYGDCLQVRLPTHRTTDGLWQSSLELPQELELPLGRAVLDACREAAKAPSC